MSGTRVLLVAERFPPDGGGLAQSGARTAAALAALGHEVEVLALSRALPPGALQTIEQPGGIVLHRLGLYGQLDVSLQHAVDVFEWLVGERRYQLAWGHYLFPAGFLAVLLAQTHGLRSIVSARGNDVDRLMFPPGDFARLSWTLERADLVTAVSADLARKIGVLLGRDRGVERVPNSVDLELFHGGEADPALAERFGIAPGETVLGFSGELRHKKGLPFLLAALSEVRRTRPACLLVIGEVRARELPQLSSFAAEHPEDGARLLVTGLLDDRATIAASYRLCDLYLQPSLWDGLPNALLEAMASERLCLASNAGAIPEALVHGEHGFLVPKAELHRFALAARELLDRPASERQALGRAARARIEEAFAPSHEHEALRHALARVGF